MKKKLPQPNTIQKNITGGAFLSIGFEFVAVFLMSTGLGWLYDNYVSNHKELGIGLLIGLFIGFAGALWHIMNRTKELSKVKEREEPQQSTTTHKTASLSDTETAHIQQLHAGIEELSEKLEATVEAAKDKPVP